MQRAFAGTGGRRGAQPERCAAAVSGLGCLHVWGMSTTEAALTTHLVMTTPACDNGFLLTTERALHDQFGIEHATIQIETGDGELGVPLPADQSLKKAPRQSEGPYPAQKRSIFYQRNFKRTCMVRGLKFWLEVSDGNRVPKFGSLGLLLKLSLRPK